MVTMLLVSPVLSAKASGVDPEVESAIKKAYAGDIDGCERELSLLASQGEPDPLVLWNLTAAQARQDRLGHSLHSMMLLLKQNPPRRLKRRALQLKETVIARLVERARRDGDPNLFALHDPRSLLEKWLAIFPGDLWRWGAYILFWLAMLAWVARSYGPGNSRNIATLMALLFLTGTAVASTSDVLARKSDSTTRLAVTVEARTLLKEGLVDGAPAQNLPEGVVLEVIDEVTEKLVLVRLGDGREGFIAVRDIAIVE